MSRNARNDEIDEFDEISSNLSNPSNLANTFKKPFFKSLKEIPAGVCLGKSQLVACGSGLSTLTHHQYTNSGKANLSYLSQQYNNSDNDFNRFLEVLDHKLK